MDRNKETGLKMRKAYESQRRGKVEDYIHAFDRSEYMVRQS